MATELRPGSKDEELARYKAALFKMEQ